MRRNIITAEDILNFLKDNVEEDNPHLELQIGELTIHECQLVIRQFDHDRKDYLNYEQFLDMLLPLSKSKSIQDRMQIVMDPNNHDYIVDKRAKLAYELEYTLLRIILQEVQLATAIEDCRRDIYSVI